MRKQSLRVPILRLTGNCLLVFAAVYCTFGAFLSAFSLPVNMTPLFWVFLLSSVAVSVSTARYGGKSLLILAGLVLILFLWRFETIGRGAQIVVFAVTTYFSQWTPVPVLFPWAQAFTDDPTVFIMIAGVVMSLLLGLTVCVRRSVVFTVIVTAPVVFLTFVITNLQADIIYLLGVVAVYLTMLVYKSINPDNVPSKEKLFFPAVASALAVMMIAFLITPVSTYQRGEQIAALNNYIRDLGVYLARLGQQAQSNMPGLQLPELGWIHSDDGDTWQFNINNVSIADSGARTISGKSLLEVSANEPGIFYLRGYSMRTFDGRSWRDNIDSSLRVDDTAARSIPAVIASFHDLLFSRDDSVFVTMSINRTGDITPNVTYQPYYMYNDPVNPTSFEQLQSFFYITGSGGVRRLMQDIYEAEMVEGLDQLYSRINSSIMHTGYTAVHISTAEQLRQLAIDAGIDPNAERAVIADAVAAYVRSAASYTLSPRAVPEGEDFAVYFLTESKEGYCIHFATAAVLMLRSLDVPARFTTGYTVRVSPGNVGNTVEVTDRNAHAWVEVYYEDIGWLYLEATPAGDGFVPAPRPHTPGDDTDPTQGSPSPPPFTSVPTPTPDGTPPGSDLSTPPGSDLSTPPAPDDTAPGGSLPYDPNSPGQGLGDGNDDPLSSRLLPPFLVFLRDASLFIICVVVFAIILPVRRKIAQKRRSVRFLQKNRNTAAIYIWRYIEQLSRYEFKAPEDIEELALKARFSRHFLTEDERSALLRYAKMHASNVYSDKGSLGRFWMKYIRAWY